MTHDFAHLLAVTGDQPLDLVEFSLRIGVALILGAAIGLERQWRQRMAGLRTNTLVSTGAALFVSIAEMTLADYEVSATRIAAQVVSGIGFIGAGVIFQQGPTVRGLTTAATLWCAAAVGALAGSGFLLPAIIGTVAILIANVAMRPVTYSLDRQPDRIDDEDTPTTYRLQFTCRKSDLQQLRSHLIQAAMSESLRLQSVVSSDVEDTGQVRIHADLVMLGRHDDLMEQLLSTLAREEGVGDLSWEVRPGGDQASEDER